MQTREEKAAYMRVYNAEHKEQISAKRKIRYALNREKRCEAQRNRYRATYIYDPIARHAAYERTKNSRLEINKRNHTKIRKEVIDYYGGQCTCCGETELGFLTIDHIDNWGAEHRKQGYSGRNLYYWIRRNNYPNTLRILCYNCNCASGKYGSCPHNKSRYSPAPFVWSEPIVFNTEVSHQRETS